MATFPWITAKKPIPVWLLASVGYTSLNAARLDSLLCFDPKEWNIHPKNLIVEGITHSNIDRFSFEEQVLGVRDEGALVTRDLRTLFETSLCDSLNHNICLEDASPEILVRLGIRWLRQLAKQKIPLDSKSSAMALAIIGTGAVWFWRPRKCNMCFQYASPGALRCKNHSRAKRIAVGPMDNIQRVRTRDASAVVRSTEQENEKMLLGPNWLLADAMDPSFVGFGCALPGFKLDSLSPVASEEDIYRLICDPHPTELGFHGEDRMAEVAIDLLRGLLCRPSIMRPDRHLSAAVEKCTHVKKLLPADFQWLCHGQQLRCLRNALDPYQFSWEGWSVSIRFAEDWYKMQEDLHSMGREGKRERLLREIQKLKNQGLKNVDIASMLGIHQSHLSRLLRVARGEEIEGIKSV